jgi:hypothetical protein
MSWENINRRLNAAGIDTSVEGLIADERAHSKDGQPGPLEKRYRAYQKIKAEFIEKQKRKQAGSAQ